MIAKESYPQGAIDRIFSDWYTSAVCEEEYFFHLCLTAHFTTWLHNFSRNHTIYEPLGSPIKRPTLFHVRIHYIIHAQPLTKQAGLFSFPENVVY